MVGAGEVGWLGSRSGPGRKYLGMGQFAGQAAANAWDAQCGAFQGGKAAHIRSRGRWRCGWIPGRRPPTLFAMRHGMLPSLGTISPKPRSAGEARASHTLRTTRVGAPASPAPLQCPSTRGGLRRRGRPHVQSTPRTNIESPCARRHPAGTLRRTPKPPICRLAPRSGRNSHVGSDCCPNAAAPSGGWPAQSHDPRRHKPERSHFHGIA